MIVYRLLLALALPFLLLATLSGRWPKATWRERLSLAPVARADWWVHGASLGELASARGVIAALAATGPVHVTTNTVTGRTLVAGWGLHGVSTGFAPFDTGGVAGRLLAQLRPRALIVIENELWPARMAAAHAAGVPVIVIGARLSARSAKRWRLASGLMARMLTGVSYLSAQDAASEARFLALGLPPAAVGPRMNLKAGVIARPQAPGPLPRHRTLLAASTHPGEETMILDAFIANRTIFDHLILAPRHPQRSNDVASLIAAQTLAFGRRSAGDMPRAHQPVFLADTTGEMDLWYPMAAVTIIGGSFAGKGGHTPFEPAAYGSAVVHGPSVHNFAEVFAALVAAGGSMAVPDSARLATALATLTPADMTALADNAAKALDAGADVAGLVSAIIAKAQPKG